VREGERVEITFVDQTTMAHPMHLHGHHFQVVAINGERFAGALRDTVLVPAGAASPSPSMPTTPAGGRCTATTSTTWPPA
jgi:FtsP/CotA-like multicopper oxidase with cupredoxin domain